MDLVDIPKCHNKYEWHKLLSLPPDKAMRLQYTFRSEAELARSGALSYAKHNSIVITTKIEAIKDSRDGGGFFLYVWRSKRTNG